MIIFPMCGRSSRFTEAGFDRPKFMLPLGKTTMFAHSVQSFKQLFEDHLFVFICRQDDESKKFIEDQFSTFNIKPEKIIVELDDETDGQADTVYQGLKTLNLSLDEGLFIFNIDSHYKNFQLPQMFNYSDSDGYLDVFEGEGEHWSFVLPATDNPRKFAAERVVEKKPISNLCSSGLYYFKSPQMFQDLFEQHLSLADHPLPQGERFVAPLYDIAIRGGLDIRYHQVNATDLCFTGTPSEYKTALKVMGPHIAFCITGQIRGSSDYLERLQKEASDVSADIFVSTWRRRGTKTFSGATGLYQLRRMFGPILSLMFPAVGYRNMHKVFPETDKFIDSLHTQSVETELRSIFKDGVLDVEDEDLILLDIKNSPSRDTNSLKMLYKIWRCNQLKQVSEEARGCKYDYVIRTRPDCIPDVKSFLASRIEEDAVYTPAILHPSPHHTLIHDMYWLGSSEQDDYLSRLFGQAVISSFGGWRGIHRELGEYFDESAFDYKEVEAIKDIRSYENEAGDLLAPFDEARITKIVDAFCLEYRHPDPVLSRVLPKEQDRLDLGHVMQIAVSKDWDSLHSFLGDVVKRSDKPYYACLRGIALLLLQSIDAENSELIKDYYDVIKDLFRIEYLAAHHSPELKPFAGDPNFHLRYNAALETFPKSNLENGSCDKLVESLALLRRFTTEP